MNRLLYVTIGSMFLAGCEATPASEIGLKPTISLPPANTDYSDRIYSDGFFDRRPVLHFDKILDDIKTPENTVDIWVDAYGTIYPETGYGDFDHKNAMRSLKRYGMDMAWALREDRSSLCLAADGGDVAEMCAVLDTDWEVLQDKYWRRKAEQIFSQFDQQDQREKEIVFLIHGFNVPDGELQYHDITGILDKYPKSDTERVYVRLMWDGGGKGDYTPIRRWKTAQFTGPLVGFQLRRLFNQMADMKGMPSVPDVKLRVMTHSSGAFVVASTFGNPKSALPELTPALEDERHPDVDSFYRSFIKHQSAKDGRWQIPQGFSPTLVFVAPATGSWTLNGFVLQKEDNPARPNNAVVATDTEGNGFYDPSRGLQAQNMRIALTNTRHDKALNRGGLGPRTFGVTTLGRQSVSYCEVERWAEVNQLNRSITGFDFNPTNSDWDKLSIKSIKGSHAWVNYLKQEAGGHLIKYMFEMPDVDFPSVSCPPYRETK